MLSVRHEMSGPTMVLITVEGKMMLGAANLSVDMLVSTLLEQGVRHFVFDLHGVTHIDSTGIGRFIASYNKIMAVEGASLRMAAAAGAVRAAFRVTHLDTVFPFFETVEQAEKAAL
jgi:anti-anti-sigma factor